MKSKFYTMLQAGERNTKKRRRVKRVEKGHVNCSRFPVIFDSADISKSTRKATKLSPHNKYDGGQFSLAGKAPGVTFM